MIKFLSSSEKNASEIVSELTAGRAELFAETEEIVESFLPFVSEESDFGFAVFGDFLLVRIRDDGVYAFVYPIALADGADEREALAEIRMYAVREEIPLIFCDVPQESLEVTETVFRFTDAYPDEEDESYTVRVASELSRLVDIPTVTDGVITLSPLTEDDIPEFARLSRDSELNKFWGYDYRDDVKDPEDRYFYREAVRGFDDGTSLSMAVRYNGRFVGEGCLWGFDLLGGAELGFRILPEWQRRGFGARTLALLIKLGDEIGLCEIRASVMKENIPSVKLLDRKMVGYFRGKNGNKYIHKY